MKVLGVSAITPLGIGTDPLLDFLASPERKMSKEKRTYSYGEHSVEIYDYRTPSFQLGNDISIGVQGRLGKYTKLTNHTIQLAVDDSGIEFPDLNRVGMIVGSGIGPMANNNQYMKKVAKYGSKGASPILFSNSTHNTAASFNGLQWKIHGPCTTFSNFELSTALSFNTAKMWLKKDIVDYVIVSIADEFYENLAIGLAIEGVKPKGIYNPLDPLTYAPGEGAASFLFGKDNVQSKYNIAVDGAFSSSLNTKFRLIDVTQPIITDFKASNYTEEFVKKNNIKNSLVSYGALYGSFPTSGAVDVAIAIKSLEASKLFSSLNTSESGNFLERDIDNIDSINLLHVGNRGEYGEINLSR